MPGTCLHVHATAEIGFCTKNVGRVKAGQQLIGEHIPSDLSKLTVLLIMLLSPRGCLGKQGCAVHMADTTSCGFNVSYAGMQIVYSGSKQCLAAPVHHLPRQHLCGQDAGVP